MFGPAADITTSPQPRHKKKSAIPMVVTVAFTIVKTHLGADQNCRIFFAIRIKFANMHYFAVFDLHPIDKPGLPQLPKGLVPLTLSGHPR